MVKEFFVSCFTVIDMVVQRWFLPAVVLVPGDAGGGGIDGSVRAT